MYLEDKIDMIIKQNQDILLELRRGSQKGLMRVSDIADYLGCSVNALYNSKRYMLPNFGRVNEGTKMEWTRMEVDNWIARGSDVLKREWDLLQLDKERGYEKRA